MTIKGISNTNTKTKSNPHYRYAMVQIKKKGYSIDTEAEKYLYDVISKGTSVVNEQVKQTDDKPRKTKRVTGYSRRIRNSKAAKREMLNMKYYRQIDRLVFDLIKEKKILPGQNLIFAFDIKNSLIKLCPLWPIC